MRKTRAKSGGFVLAAWSVLFSGCADDPFDFDAPRSCDVAGENEWLDGVMQEIYLFNDEMPQLDPLDYATPEEYVRALRVPPDRWSRVSDKATSEALYKDGEFVGLGYSNRRNFDDEVVISLVIPGSPAADAGLERGDIIRAIGGLHITTLDAEDRWSEVTGENVPGVTVDLTVERDGVERDVELTKDWIELQTVPDDDIFEIDGRKVGYLLFASFLDPAHDALDDAFRRFANAGVRELVLDMRYNGGGLLDVARHLISLVIDRKGAVAYRVVYNDNFSDQDHDVQITSHAGTLSEVDHVVVITTGSTLSASELVINALRPYVKVSIVGDTTGGKPVGSRHLEFCDKMLAALTFKLVNASGEGDYFDGLAADCPAIDDFGHDLGDPAEASLASAFAIVRGEACPELPDPAEVHAGADARLRVGPPAATPRRDDLPDEVRGLF